MEIVFLRIYAEFYCSFHNTKDWSWVQLYSFGTLLPNAKEEQMIYILPLKIVGVYLKV